MSIVNHTKISKLNFPKKDRKYLLKITIGQCESHLLYMQILSPSHHSYQHDNKTLRRATPSSIRNTSLAYFVTTKSVFDDTLYSQEPVTFVKEFNDDDVT